jgi:ketosteroid isomerase-like protein
MDLERRTREYVSAVEGGAVADDLAAFYHPDVMLEEFPNRLVPAGVRRGLEDILKGAEAGQRAMSRQRFDVHTLTVAGDRVVLEATWTGWLAVPFGTKRAGETLSCRMAQVIEFEDGKIIRQRTYDCYEPF